MAILRPHAVAAASRLHGTDAILKKAVLPASQGDACSWTKKEGLFRAPFGHFNPA